MGLYLFDWDDDHLCPMLGGLSSQDKQRVSAEWSTKIDAGFEMDFNIGETPFDFCVLKLNMKKKDGGGGPAGTLCLDDYEVITIEVECDTNKALAPVDDMVNPQVDVVGRFMAVEALKYITGQMDAQPNDTNDEDIDRHCMVYNPFRRLLVIYWEVGELGELGQHIAAAAEENQGGLVTSML